MKITTIGVDLAKEVFQIHGVNDHGKTMLRNTTVPLTSNRGGLIQLKLV